MAHDGHIAHGRQTSAGGAINLYGKAKTPPKWRTQSWHLTHAAWATSEEAQNQVSSRMQQASIQSAMHNASATGRAAVAVPVTGGVAMRWQADGGPSRLCAHTQEKVARVLTVLQQCVRAGMGVSPAGARF